MKPPPFLIGAALVFWGWESDFLIAGVVMAVVLESARFVKTRWELSNEDFSRIWTFCTLLFLATAAYGFTSTNGPSRIGELLSNGSLAAQNGVGRATAKTAVLLIRWMPMAFFLFIAAQVFSDREGIPLETISLILRRRWRRAKEAGEPPPPTRTVNVGYPYVIMCLFAASGHAPGEDKGFFWGLCALLAWTLWPRRSQRFGFAVWVGAMGVAVALGYGGERGLMRLKQAVDQYNPDWLAGFANQGFDPMESRTEIGQLGRIKTSSRIVIRLETPDGQSAPAYLREAAYRTYHSAVWYAGSSKDDYRAISEQPPDSGSGIWPLIPGKTNGVALNIACYLPGGKGLLPLPTDSRCLEQLPAFEVQKNSVGVVKATGPGLVIFNALYGPGGSIEQPPDANEDIGVPEKEKPALDKVISELHLQGQKPEKMPQNISQFFATQFTYSLWQEPPKVKETNDTALSRFLLKTRSGHCEYFATATVLLLRELGVPARYAVGYAVHEADGNKYVVRQSDAHAWCRVWDARLRQWEDFDTTPGIWMTMERQQRSAFQFVSDAWSRAMFEFSKFRWGQSRLRNYIFMGLVPVLGLLLYQIIRNGKRKGAASSKTAANVVWPGLDSEMYQLERAFAKRGLSRHPSEAAAAWLQRMAARPEFTEMKKPLMELLRLHYRYRFDPRGLSDGEREVLRREATTCLRSI